VQFIPYKENDVPQFRFYDYDSGNFIIQMRQLKYNSDVSKFFISVKGVFTKDFWETLFKEPEKLGDKYVMPNEDVNYFRIKYSCDSEEDFFWGKTSVTFSIPIDSDHIRNHHYNDNLGAYDHNTVIKPLYRYGPYICTDIGSDHNSKLNSYAYCNMSHPPISQAKYTGYTKIISSFEQYGSLKLLDEIKQSLEDINIILDADAMIDNIGLWFAFLEELFINAFIGANSDMINNLKSMMSAVYLMIIIFTILQLMLSFFMEGELNLKDLGYFIISVISYFFIAIYIEFDELIQVIHYFLSYSVTQGFTMVFDLFEVENVDTFIERPNVTLIKYFWTNNAVDYSGILVIIIIDIILLALCLCIDLYTAWQFGLTLKFIKYVILIPFVFVIVSLTIYTSLIIGYTFLIFLSLISMYVAIPVGKFSQFQNAPRKILLNIIEGMILVVLFNIFGMAIMVMTVELMNDFLGFDQMVTSVEDWLNSFSGDGVIKKSDITKFMIANISEAFVKTIVDPLRAMIVLIQIVWRQIVLAVISIIIMFFKYLMFVMYGNIYMSFWVKMHDFIGGLSKMIRNAFE